MRTPHEAPPPEYTLAIFRRRGQSLRRAHAPLRSLKVHRRRPACTHSERQAPNRAKAGASAGIVMHMSERDEYDLDSWRQTIQRHREARSMSEHELARRATRLRGGKTVSARMVAAIEIGRAKPSLGTLEAIAAVFGMSLRELLSEWSQPAFAKPPAAADDVLH